MAHEDLSPIRHALGLARERGFAEVVLEFGDVKFKAALQSAPKAAPAPAAAATASGEPVSEAPAYSEVKATLVGYAQPARNAVEVGNVIEPGQIVASITALGISTDVESPIGGEVVEVLFEANQAVEYGQPLLRVKP